MGDLIPIEWFLSLGRLGSVASWWVVLKWWWGNRFCKVVPAVGKRPSNTIQIQSTPSAQ